MASLLCLRNSCTLLFRVRACSTSVASAVSSSTSSAVSSSAERRVRAEENPQCFLCGSIGHLARACPDKPPLLSRDERPKERSQDVCERCLQKEHMAVECVNDPHPKSTLCCPLCGVNGHMKHQCPDLFKVNGPGHVGNNALRCKLCGLQGHLDLDCTHRKSILPWQ